QRVEITGSSIKRLEGETALPVQTLRREDIDKTGATTAAELLANITASAANLGDGASITDNTGGQRGFNGANLRGVDLTVHPGEIVALMGAWPTSRARATPRAWTSTASRPAPSSASRS
ncbi:MAG: hypothetical protein RLZZ341_2510, partial [Pseudomonadota bacterium]